MMKKLGLILILFLILACCITTSIIPYISFDQLFPKLEMYVDTYRVQQTFQPQINVRACRFSLIQHEKLITTQSRDTVWSRLPEEWGDGSGLFSSFGDQSHYYKDINDTWRIRSWIFYDSAATYETPVHLTNSLVFEFC